MSPRALTFEQRNAIRLALDEKRRLELDAHRAAAGAPELCMAVALSGRACRNLPGPSGFCGVHARAYAA